LQKRPAAAARPARRRALQLTWILAEFGPKFNGTISDFCVF